MKKKYLLNGLIIIFVIVTCGIILFGLKLVIEKSSYDKLYSRIGICEYIYTELENQLDNIEEFSFTETDFYIYSNSSESSVYVNEISQSIDIEIDKNKKKVFYWIAVIKNKKLEYIILSDKKIENNVILKQYSFDEQLILMKNPFKQDISTYPY